MPPCRPLATLCPVVYAVPQEKQRSFFLRAQEYCMPPLLEPLRYTLRFPAPHTHYVEVEAAIPTAGQPWVELVMAVWTPGSYMVREYARHVEGVTAHTSEGRSLRVDKTRKNRWRIDTKNAALVVVTYRVYGREM